MKSILLTVLLPFSLSALDYYAIGQKIWQNEAGKKTEYLIFWNPKEEFPSLGIGHFIWYPATYQGPFVQTFPQFLNFCKIRHYKIPAWLEKVQSAPWPTREAFLKDKDSSRMKELRTFLEKSMDLQAQFIVSRFQQSLDEIYNGMTPQQKRVAVNRVKKLINDTQGLYILVDYLNFKGAGTSEKERYKGHGWGLLQVLQEMKPRSEKINDLIVSFADTAVSVLKRRIENSPSERHEQGFLAGWANRIKTYLPDSNRLVL